MPRQYLNEADEVPKAYSYIRFSSAKQQSGDSVERQTKLSANYAAKHGLELDTQLNMSDLGISAYDGANLKKGALGQFLLLVEEGRIEKGSFLLVESLDRLSRDKVMDALSIFSDILRAGIVIVTLADEQVYSYEKVNDNWASLILSIVIMSRANEESAMKSMRIRSSWDAKRSSIDTKRLTKRCPYWLKPSDGDTGFEFIPERVDVVKRIFKMSRDGIGSATIVKTLNTEGVPTFSTETNGWQNSYIQKVLASPAAYGDLHLKLQRDGEITPVDVIEGYYPAVVSKEDWLLTSSARKARRNRGGGWQRPEPQQPVFRTLEVRLLWWPDEYGRLFGDPQRFSQEVTVISRAAVVAEGWAASSFSGSTTTSSNWSCASVRPSISRRCSGSTHRLKPRSTMRWAGWRESSRTSST